MNVFTSMRIVEKDSFMVGNCSSPSVTGTIVKYAPIYILDDIDNLGNP